MRATIFTSEPNPNTTMPKNKTPEQMEELQETLCDYIQAEINHLKNAEDMTNFEVQEIGQRVVQSIEKFRQVCEKFTRHRQREFDRRNLYTPLG